MGTYTAQGSIRIGLDISSLKANAAQAQQILNKLQVPNLSAKKMPDLFDNYNKQLETYQSYVDRINSGEKLEGPDIKNFTKAGNELKSTIKSIESTWASFKGNFNISDSSLAALDSTFKGILDNINNINKAISNAPKYEPLRKSQLDALQNPLEEAMKARKKEGKSETKSAVDALDYIKKFTAANQSGDIQKAEAAYNKLATLVNGSIGFKNLGADLKDPINSAFNFIKSNIDSFKNTPITLEINGEKVKLTLEELQTKLAEFKDQSNEVGGALKENLKSGLEGYIKNISNSIPEINAYKNNFDEILKQEKEYNKQTDQLKNRVTYFFGISNALNLVKRTATQAFNTIKDLDAAMTETAVVTNYSISDMWEQLSRYTDIANKLGTTTKGAYETMTLYYQQGLNTEQAFGVGGETMKMARVGGIDYETAAQYMTNALRGFDMAINEKSAKRVNDVYSELAAISAADTSGIATAMTKVASIANAANMTFENTSAFLTQILETTQEAPETAGTALKTIIARFSEVKKLYTQDQLTGIDGEGEAIDINKIDTALKAVGLSLNQFVLGNQGLDEIFLQLAEKWDTLDTATQRYIATQAAGSRQQSRFIAMMDNYTRTTELTTAAINAEGSGQQQFEKTLDSMEAKLNQLNNAKNEFSMGLLNQDVLKAGIDSLTTILDLVNKITSVSSSGMNTVLKGGGLLGLLGLGRKLINNGTAKFRLGKARDEEVSKILMNAGMSEEVKQSEIAKVEENYQKSIQSVRAQGFKQSQRQQLKQAKQEQDQLQAQYDEKKDLAVKAEQELSQARSEEQLKNNIYEQAIDNYDIESTDNNLQNAEQAGKEYEQARQTTINKQSEVDKAKEDEKSADQALRANQSRIDQLDNWNIKAQNAAIGIGAISTALGIAANAFNTSSKAGKKWADSLTGISNVGAVLTPVMTVISILPSTLAAALGPIALIVGGIAAVATIIDALTESASEKTERYNQFAKDAETAANDASAAYDNLISAKSGYDELRSQLQGLTEGTLEYEQALLKANQAALDMYDLYSGFGLSISFNNGAVTIDEESYQGAMERASDYAVQMHSNQQLASAIKAYNDQNGIISKNIEGLYTSALQEYIRISNQAYNKEDILLHWGQFNQQFGQILENAGITNGASAKDFAGALLQAGKNGIFNQISTTTSQEDKKAILSQIDSELGALDLNQAEALYNAILPILQPLQEVSLNMQEAGATWLKQTKIIDTKNAFLNNLGQEYLSSLDISAKGDEFYTEWEQQFTDGWQSKFAETWKEMGKSTDLTTITDAAEREKAKNEIIVYLTGNKLRDEVQGSQEYQDFDTWTKGLADSTKDALLKSNEYSFEELGQILSGDAGFYENQDLAANTLKTLMTQFKEAYSNTIEALQANAPKLTKDFSLDKFTISQMTDIETYSNVIGEKFGTSAAESIIGNLVNDFEAGSSKVKQVLDSLRFSDALGFVTSLNIAESKAKLLDKDSVEIYENIRNAANVSQKDLFTSLINGEDFDKVLEKSKELLDTNEEITASDVEDLASNYEILGKYLDASQIKAAALANILTSINNGEIDASNLTNGLIEAVNAASELKQGLADAKKYIKDYNPGESGKQFADFFGDRAKNVLELINGGFFPDETVLNDLEVMGGKRLLEQYSNFIEAITDDMSDADIEKLFRQMLPGLEDMLVNGQDIGWEAWNKYQYDNSKWKKNQSGNVIVGGEQGSGAFTIGKDGSVTIDLSLIQDSDNNGFTTYQDVVKQFAKESGLNENSAGAWLQQWMSQRWGENYKDVVQELQLNEVEVGFNKLVEESKVLTNEMVDIFFSMFPDTDEIEKKRNELLKDKQLLDNDWATDNGVFSAKKANKSLKDYFGGDLEGGLTQLSEQEVINESGVILDSMTKAFEQTGLSFEQAQEAAIQYAIDKGLQLAAAYQDIDGEIKYATSNAEDGVEGLNKALTNEQNRVKEELISNAITTALGNLESWVNINIENNQALAAIEEVRQALIDLPNAKVSITAETEIDGSGNGSGKGNGSGSGDGSGNGSDNGSGSNGSGSGTSDVEKDTNDVNNPETETQEVIDELEAETEGVKAETEKVEAITENIEAEAENVKAETEKAETITENIEAEAGEVKEATQDTLSTVQEQSPELKEWFENTAFNSEIPYSWQQAKLEMSPELKGWFENTAFNSEIPYSWEQAKLEAKAAEMAAIKSRPELEARMELYSIDKITSKIGSAIENIITDNIASESQGIEQIGELSGLLSSATGQQASAKETYDANQAEVNRLQIALDNATQYLADNQAYIDAQSEAEDARVNAENKSAQLAFAEASIINFTQEGRRIDTAQARIDELNTKLSTAQDKVDDKAAKYNQAYEDYNNNADSMIDPGILYDAMMVAYSELETATEERNSLKKELKQAEIDLQGIEGNLATLESLRAEASAEADEANAAAEAAKAAADEAKAIVDASREKAGEDDVDTLQTELDTAKELRDTAYELYRDTSETVTSLQGEIETTQADIDRLNITRDTIDSQVNSKEVINPGRYFNTFLKMLSESDSESASYILRKGNEWGWNFNASNADGNDWISGIGSASSANFVKQLLGLERDANGGFTELFDANFARDFYNATGLPELKPVIDELNNAVVKDNKEPDNKSILNSNLNPFNRPIIDSSILTELGYGDLPPQSYATFFSGAGNYEGYSLAYTPIFQNDEGKWDIMEQDALDNYLFEFSDQLNSWLGEGNTLADLTSELWSEFDPYNIIEGIFGTDEEAASFGEQISLASSEIMQSIINSIGFDKIAQEGIIPPEVWQQLASATRLNLLNKLSDESDTNSLLELFSNISDTITEYLKNIDDQVEETGKVVADNSEVDKEHTEEPQTQDSSDNNDVEETIIGQADEGGAAIVGAAGELSAAGDATNGAAGELSSAGNALSGAAGVDSSGGSALIAASGTVEAGGAALAAAASMLAIGGETQARHGKIGGRAYSIPGYAKGRSIPRLGHINTKPPRNYEGVAQVGEEGPELIVGPNGTYLAGVHGQTFTYLHKDDSVYTAQQTRQILGSNGNAIPGFASGVDRTDIPGFSDSISQGTKLQLGKKSKGDSSSDAKKEKEKEEAPYENKLDKLQNLIEHIDKTTRNIEQIEHQQTTIEFELEHTVNKIDYNKLWSDFFQSYQDTLKEQTEQIKNYQTKIEGRKLELNKLMYDQYSMQKYAYYDEDLDEIVYDWAQLEKVKDSDAGKEIDDYIDELEKYVEDIHDSQDEINKIEEEIQKAQEQLEKKIEEQEKQYRDSVNDIREAIADFKQSEIDKLSEMSEAQDDNNNKILENMQKVIDEQRKLRNLQENKDDLEEKQRRLQLLRRDSSGANAVEIKKLEEEIEKDQEGYVDSLVDYSLEQIQESNDLAAEQRQQQIDLLQEILDFQKENGYFNQQAEELFDGLYDSMGNINWESDYVKLMQWRDKYDAMTLEEQEEWRKTFEEDNVLAQAGQQAYMEDYLSNFWDQYKTLRDAGETSPDILDKILYYWSKDDFTAEDLKDSKKVVPLLETAIDEWSKVKSKVNGSITTGELKKDLDDAAEKLKEAAQALKKNDTAETHKAYTDALNYYNGKKHKYDTAVDYKDMLLGLINEAKGKLNSDYGVKYTPSSTVSNNTLKTSSSKSSRSSSNNSGKTDWNAEVQRRQAQIDALTKQKFDQTAYSTKYDIAQKKQTSTDKNGNTVTSKATSTTMSGMNANYKANKQAIADYNARIDKQIADLEKKKSNAQTNLDNQKKNKVAKAANGGLFDTTGLMQIDGTASKPELVLNPTDTKNFLSVIDILRGIDISSLGSGTTYYDIHIDVDRLSSDYDVEQVANKIKSMITSDASYRNNNVLNFIR